MGSAPEKIEAILSLHSPSFVSSPDHKNANPFEAASWEEEERGSLVCRNTARNVPKNNEGSVRKNKQTSDESHSRLLPWKEIELTTIDINAAASSVRDQALSSVDTISLRCWHGAAQRHTFAHHFTMCLPLNWAIN